ncbi:MAG: PKD domain-containing protein [Micropruina sp.]|uniref:PKD domain-containing protein n=1 Tax=Micropruina sp. TaxID=2737536 RepID=UPI0039E4E41F
MTLLSATALAALGSVAGVSRAEAAPATIQPQPNNSITADRLPTAQINGVVWSTDVAGNKVYAGGSFTRARPAGAAAGSNETVRNNLLAFDITTGNLDTSFAPDLNGQVLAVAVSPDKTRVYVVGDFTTANGQARRRVAAYSTATGALITSFNPVGVNSRARAVAATNTTVYVGGGFAGAGNSSRGNLAAFRASDGALLPWAPAAERPVWGLAVSPDTANVYAAGQFTTIGGQAAYGMAKMDATSGALDAAWKPEVRNGGDDAAVGSIRIQNNAIYGTSWHFGAGGNLEGTFKIPLSSSTGSADWVTDCHGDTYGAFVSQSTVYVAGHSHYCGNMGGGFPQYSSWKYQHAQAWSDTVTGDILNDPHFYYNWSGKKQGPAMINWLPEMAMGSYTGQYQAGWTVTGNDDFIVFGGEFPRVNGTAQQGLVRFGKRPVAPGSQGPMFAAGSFVPKISAQTATSARITWPAAYDRDDRILTYRVYRGSTLISTQAVESNWWTLPALGYTDTGVSPGAGYSYRVTVSDPGGNLVNSSTVSYTQPGTVAASNSYTQSVLSAGADLYWPLNDARTGNPMTIRDRSGYNDGVADTDVTAGQPGAITGDAAMTFGTAQPTQAFGRVYANGTQYAPDTFTAQAWIKTDSTTGGRILGFGDLQTGNSGHRDRHVYMTNDGKLIFGVRATNGNNRTVISGRSYNDNQWHMVTATMGSQGMALYVDGVRVGRRSDTTQGETYLGYWRLQGDNLAGWTSAPSNYNFVGSVDEVAVYPTALDQNTILGQYSASGRTADIPPVPADNYGAAVYNDDPDLFWRFDETTGTTAADSGRAFNDGTYRNGVTLGEEGVIAGNRAARFDGSDDVVTSNGIFSNPAVYTVEAWFKTTSTTGGKIIGFGNAQSGNSGSYDRHVYMLANGKLAFGTYTGQSTVITSNVSFNDGGWHHVVASQSSSGMKLYVDGEIQATNPQAGAQAYDGYWRVGGDNSWSGNPYFNGTIDEVAVYSTELPLGRVVAHYQAGGGVLNQAPSAEFSSSAEQRRVTFAGTGTDPDGTITAYSWDFGDGGTSTAQNPVHVYTQEGTFTATLTVTDNKGATGSISHPVTVTAPPGPSDTYGSSVYADHPRLYWRFGETSGTVANDVAGGLSHGTIVNNPVMGRPGAIDNPNTAFQFNGNGKYVTSNDALVNPTVYSEEAWFKTTTTAGGKIMGFGCTFTSPSSCYDRHIYMLANGKVAFGTYTGAMNIITTSDSYNDGSWHHVVATQSSDGMRLYLDGVLQGSNPQTGAQAYDGYLHVGGDTSWSGATWFNGEIDEVAVYLSELGAGRVQAHYQAAQPAPNQDPVASFTLTKTDLQIAVDGSASSDPDGTVAGYLWDFGDGQTSTAPVTTHSYTTGGTYTVKLTVTDDDGTTNSKTQSVTVQAANVNPVAAFTATVDHLDVDVDASTSSDPDGTIASYEWNFGDGSTGTGKVTDHTYTSAGTFTIALKVTDDRGGSHTVTHDVVTTMPPNQHPNAAFTSSVSKLKVNFTNQSTDPDGTVASYAWDFGDGGTSTQASPSHTYASAGTWTVKLTVTDNGGETDEVTHQVTTVANQAPTASFSHTVNGMAVSFNGTGSSDPDGTVASYAWTFGDGGTGTGASPSHSYAAAGSYTVKLTVTDNDGATGDVTQTVTVAAPTQIAADDFNRTVSNGWGNADLGGAWTRSGTASNFAVSSGSATITMTAGVGPGSYLNSVSARDVELRTSVSYDKPGTGGGTYTSFIVRRNGTTDYRAVVRVTSTATTVQFQRTVNGTATVIGNTVTLSGGALTANETLRLKVQATGANSTTLRAKVWRAAASEPTAWTVSTTDSTSGLQTAGSVGVYSYMSGSSTNSPIVAKFAEFIVEPA